jgi:putative addiction module CopG family antidote
MSIGIPAGYSSFVDQLIAEGVYRSQEEVGAEGLRLLQNQEQLRLEVKKGFDEIAQGRLVPADVVFAKARKRIEEIASGEE